MHTHIAVLCVLLIMLTSCSGAQQLAPSQQAVDTTPGQQLRGLSDVTLFSTPPRRLDSVSIESAVAAAQEMPVPAGVDPVVFADLLAALIGALQPLAGKIPSELPSGNGNLVTDLELVPDGGGGVLSWTYVNLGDYNLDGLVSINDLTPIGQYFLVAEGDSSWESARKADGNKDGRVTINDITQIGANYGASALGYNIYGRSGSGPYTLVTSVTLADGSGVPLHFSVPLASIDYDTYAVAPYDSTGEDVPQQTLPSPRADVLDPAVVQITEVMGDNVVLSGDVSDIQVGGVIVSAEGEGMLRRVESLTPVAGGVELVTSQATLEDLFDYMRLDHEEGLPYEAMAEFIPAMEGVELTRVEPPAEASNLHGGSAELSTGWIHLTMTRKLHQNLSISGKISFNSGIDMEVEIGTGWSDFGELQRFKTSLWIDGKVEGTVKAFREFKLNESRQQIGTIRFAPMIIPVGIIPVVIVPEFEIWLTFTASGEVAIETSSKGFAEMEVGMEYTKDNGWLPITDVDFGFEDDNNSTSFAGKIKGEFGIFSPELDLALYGVVGPFVTFSVPYIDLEAGVISSGGEFTTVYVQSGFGIKASCGAEVEVLGKTLDRWDAGEIINLRQNVFYLRDDLTDHRMVAGYTRNSFDTDERIADVELVFLKGGDWFATTSSNEDGIFAKLLPYGTYDVEAAHSSYFPLEVQSYEVSAEYNNLLSFVDLDPHWDENTVMVNFTSHAEGAEVTEPIIILEGQLGYGNEMPDCIGFEFASALGTHADGYLYPLNFAVPDEWVVIGAEYVKAIRVEDLPGGAFSIPVVLQPGETQISCLAFRYSGSNPPQAERIYTSTHREPLTLNSTREQAAMLVMMGWWGDVLDPENIEPATPGVPNEDLRLIVHEPDGALVSGQGAQSGRGHILHVPTTWHWYYWLPVSQAQAGEIYSVYANFHTSIYRTEENMWELKSMMAQTSITDPRLLEGLRILAPLTASGRLNASPSTPTRAAPAGIPFGTSRSPANNRGERQPA